jgi:hypothetical protein
MTSCTAPTARLLPRARPCERFNALGQPCGNSTRRLDGWCGRCAGNQNPSVSRWTSPDALRAAIASRVKIDTDDNRNWDINRRHLYFAFGRLLARLFTAQPEQWVVKGGFALLTRTRSARPSKDLDLAFLAGPASLGLERLRQAAALDLGDQVTLEVGDPQRLIEGNSQGLRLLIQCKFGHRLLVTFPVDLVECARVALEPDWLPPVTAIDVPDLPQAPAWAIWPLPQHAADKVCACLEVHGNMPSTRYRDLPDLWLMASQLTSEPEALAEAIRAEANRRGLRVPTKFVVPNPTTWRNGWKQLARSCPQLRQQTFDGALSQVQRWLAEPLSQLAGR